ncbi:MAG: TIM barrel protein [Acidobacteriota bacterium]|jgi:sugar phosphate isomerase/epimerase
MESSVENKPTASGSSNSFQPKLAMCNFIPGIDRLGAFAREHRFSGIDYSFDLKTLPRTPSLEAEWVKGIHSLEPMEVRFHCPFERVDLGHDDAEKVREAEDLFWRVIRLVSKAGGQFVTIHIGLGHESTEPLSWEITLEKLKRLVQYGRTMQVKVCLENLAWGWTSKPNLFEKLIRTSGAGVTLDIGHAHACESVQSRYYTVEDFVSPHADRVYNAHVYHTELLDEGHITPSTVDEIKDRLSLLKKLRCTWWVLEIRQVEGLLQTREIVDAYLQS